MDVSDFINNLLTSVPFTTETAEDRKLRQRKGIEALIHAKLISRQYRTKTITAELDKQIKEKISLAVNGNKPLHFTIPFGGYKLWKFPTYPGPDYAELFNLLQLRSYLSRICSFYKAGVKLEYWSDEIMVGRMNNYPQSDLDKYNDLFTDMILWFSKYLPENFVICFNKIRNKISFEEYQRKTDEYIKINKAKWSLLPKEQQLIRLKKAERNYKGDFTAMTENEKHKLLLDSALSHDAFIFGDWDEKIPWAFDKHMIALGFQYTNNWGIPIKSSLSSMSQFWVGMGILKAVNNIYIPSIVTYQQYLQIKNKLDIEKVADIPKKFIHLQSIAVLND